MSELTDIWADRRVRIGYETAEELTHKFNDFNWRGHPESQADALDDSLETLHWVGSVKVNISTNRIFDGHLRVKRALVKNPSMPIPVDYYDLTEDEELLALTIHDAITEQAEPIPDKLAALLARTREMTADRPGLGAMLQKLKERAGINGHQPKEDAGPQIDKAAELQKVWGVKVGDVWELGQHRLVCGDCTDRATVEAVMRGGRAEAVCTDVPYEISQESNGLRRLDYGEWDKDGATEAAIKSIRLCSDIMTISAFCGDEQLSYILSLWGDRTTRTLAWVKPNPTVLNGQHVFLPAIELAAHGRKAGAWFGGHCIRNVWEGTSPNDRSHPNEKPVGLFAWVIENTCSPNGLVYDPFLGSGTTLIACENLNRRCRGVEIDPGYCAVTLERWSQLTGKTPRRVAG